MSQAPIDAGLSVLIKEAPIDAGLSVSNKAAPIDAGLSVLNRLLLATGLSTPPLCPPAAPNVLWSWPLPPLRLGAGVSAGSGVGAGGLYHSMYWHALA